MPGPSEFATLLEQLRLAHAQEIASLKHHIGQLQQQLQNGHRASQLQIGHRASQRPSQDTSVAVTVSASIDQATEPMSRSSVSRNSVSRNSRSSDISVRGYKNGMRPTIIIPRFTRNSFAPDPTKGTSQRSTAKPSTLVGKLSMAQTHEFVSELESGNLLRRLRGRLVRLVTSHVFERLFLSLSMFSVFLIALEMQAVGMFLGGEIEYYDHALGEDYWGYNFLHVAVLSCSILFAAESAAKVVAGTFLWDWANFVDLAVVIIEIVGMLLLSDVIAVSFLRLCRLLRVGRLYRALMDLPGIDELYLMMTALRGCLGILFWSSVLLLTVQMVMAICISQFLFVTYFKDPSNSMEAQRNVFEYFGTFTRSTLSMFEITLANWPPACRLLAENVTEWFMLLCIIYKLTIGFAVVAVINGVFMKETFKVADTDDVIMMKQTQKSAGVHAMKMRMLFEEADINGDGELDIDEFREVVGSPSISAWLTSQGICCDDVESLFQVLDCQANEDGKISYEELCQGIARLKGNAKSVDVVNLLHGYKKGARRVSDLRKQVASLVAEHRALNSLPASRSTSVTLTAPPPALSIAPVTSECEVATDGLSEAAIVGERLNAIRRTPSIVRRSSV